MKFFAGAFLVFSFLICPLAADELLTFKDAKAKFTVRYPTDWKLAPQKAGSAFMSVAPDGTANVQIMTDVVKGRTTACEYLAKTEAAAEGGRTNLIPENKRSVLPTQLKFMGVKDGCMGAYKIVLDKTEVLQGTGVYTSGKNVWILIQTLHTAAADRHAKGVGEIAKSFTVK
jgi:hypothetical protein